MSTKLSPRRWRYSPISARDCDKSSMHQRSQRKQKPTVFPVTLSSGSRQDAVVEMLKTFTERLERLETSLGGAVAAWQETNADDWYRWWGRK